MKQLTLATARFERYAKTTRRATFLAEMERVMPWAALCQLIEPYYPKPGLRVLSRKIGVTVRDCAKLSSCCGC